MDKKTTYRGLLALSPLAVFLCLYLVTSLVMGDFYKMPITVAFAVSAVYGVCITTGLTLKERIASFSAGASDSNIMLMIWIFILAGAFATTARDMGAIDSTVALLLRLLPDGLIPAGLFLAACFISLSVGTSVGTIVALVPVAAGIADATSSNMAMVVAIVVGGAFFGDNLSFISDTTIAATRTQGCGMLDKFRANLRIVLPAAIVVFGFYLFYGLEFPSERIVYGEVDYLKIVPYIVVLVTALSGMNVALVLVLGILCAGIIGLATGSVAGVFGLAASMGAGIDGMSELIIITLLAGGMMELIRYNGGIDYIISNLTRRVSGRRGGEFCIAALVSLANVCTANNTIAIITVGPLAADISRRYGIDPRKSASILDTFSCVVQGVLPYGAQLLMAASLSGVSPLSIIGYLYYPMAVFVCAVLGILIKNRRRRPASEVGK